MKKNITKILIIIAVITVCIGAKVYADYVMNASEVEYTKSDSTKVSVKAALDDLYTKSQQSMSQPESLDELNNICDELNSLSFSSASVELYCKESKSITITNPNNLEITVETSDASIVAVTKNSNTQVTINTLSKEGEAEITAKATLDNKTYKVKTIGVNVVGEWNGEGEMTVAFAKAGIDASNIRNYQGTIVDYHPASDPTGVYRIFYYDETGKYGDGAGTVYIKRDYNSSTTINYESYKTYYTNSTNKSAILSDMKKFNPQWKARDNSINSTSEQVASYLCYHGAWTTYLDSSVAKYAIGSPSAEMYIDAWNQYKGSKVLDYKWVANGASLSHGSSGGNGYAYAPAYGKTSITDFGTASAVHSLTTEANSMFITSGSDWFLASPHCSSANTICSVQR